MSQAVSLDLSMYIDRESDDYPVFLLELTHPDYPGAIRLCSSNVKRLGHLDNGMPKYGLRSNLGNEGAEEQEFLYLPMALTPPSQEEDGAPSASLTVFRSDELVILLRSFRTRIAVKMYQVSAQMPHFVRAVYPGFSLTSVEIGGATIQGNMGLDMQETEPFPGLTFSRRWFPGVHP